MRVGWTVGLAVALALCVAASSRAQALMWPPRQVHYPDERIAVRLVKGAMTKIIFPDPVPVQRFPVSVQHLKLRRDAMDARQLVIHSIDPPPTLEFTVNTTRQPYPLVLERSADAPDSVVTVLHPPAVPAEAPPAETPLPPIRSLWISQWRGDPERPEPGVTLRPLSGIRADTAEQLLEYRFHIEGLGYYGWTLALTNKTRQPKSLQLEQIRDPQALLVSIIAQHLGSPYVEARALEVIQPRETILLHLLYKEGGAH